MFEKIDQESKHKLAVLSLLCLVISAAIAHIIHWFQVDPFGLNRIGSGITAIFSFIYLVLIYKKPKRLETSVSGYLIVIRLMMIIVSLMIIVIVRNVDDLTLIEYYPPFTAFSFLWITMVVIFVPYQKLISFIVWGCLPLSIPIILYLLLHPTELKTGRGFDLFITHGMATVVYVIVSLFYASLQLNLKQLSEERLNYYSKIITTQNIRQAAIAETFTSGSLGMRPYSV